MNKSTSEGKNSSKRRGITGNRPSFKDCWDIEVELVGYGGLEGIRKDWRGRKDRVLMGLLC